MAPPAQKDGKGGGSKRGNVNMQISISKRKAKCIRFHFECVPPNLPISPPPSSFIQRGTVNRIRWKSTFCFQGVFPRKFEDAGGEWWRTNRLEGYKAIYTPVTTTVIFFLFTFLFLYFLFPHKVFWNFAQLYNRIMLRYAVITVIIGLWLLWRKFIK